MIYLDSETCGLCGPMILLQYAEDSGPIHLHNVWTTPIYETMKIIEWITENEICGFNLAFDWFQISKIYTMFLLVDNKQLYPEDCIEELALLEEKARFGPCLKPRAALDLMLHARKTVYQSTMNRGDIRIRRVPTVIAWELCAELEKRIKLKDIYFARKKNKFAPHFQVFDIVVEGEVVKDFKDVVLKFAPSSALKALAADALNLEPDTILYFVDIDVDKHYLPKEVEFAPFATAIGKPGAWNGAWPSVISHHITHWQYNNLARQYAEKDVSLTRRLADFFGNPAAGDNDSELACLVGSVRWKGFSVDLKGIEELKQKAIQRKANTPTAPGPVKRWIEMSLSEVEKLAMGGSTKKIILEEIAKLTMLDCPVCSPNLQEVNDAFQTSEDINEFWEGIEEFDFEEKIKVETITVCEKCNGEGRIPNPAALKAQQVLDAREATSEIMLYDKILQAKRFHAGFNIIGALSSRMSGTNKLNAQGIKRTKEVRSVFTLADSDCILSGGDFASFEIVLAEAAYSDPDLRKDLQEGKKIHGLFGEFLFPGCSYAEIVKSAGSDWDMYEMSKRSVFALVYGGNGDTIHNKVGIDLEIAERACQMFATKYPGVGRAQKFIFDRFCSMKQLGGIGTKVTWDEPAEYIESLFGFRRYFTLENQICKALYQLANKCPEAWKKHTNVKVYRRDREQTALGAVQSALYGAAFAIQSGNMRAATNHQIQSSGAEITKHVQRKIWDLQLPGIRPWVVQPMQCHDEILLPVHPDYVDKVEEVVNEAVESYRDRVPLIRMDWKKKMANWGEK